LLTRLNNQKHGAIIIVMQRLHEDDLAGHVLSAGRQEGYNRDPAGHESGNTTASESSSLHWVHLDLPAIAIKDQRIQISKNKFYNRKANEILHPPARDGKSWKG